jgi:hypothetical protein
VSQQLSAIRLENARFHAEDKAYFEKAQRQLATVDRKVEGLSHQVCRGFETLGVALNRVTAQVAVEMARGNDELRDGFASFRWELEGRGGGGLTAEWVARLVDERLGGLGQEIQSQLKDALAGVWAEQRSLLTDPLGLGLGGGSKRDGADPSREDKIDAVLAVVRSLETKITSFGEDFRRYREMSARCLADAEGDHSPMPKTFFAIDQSQAPAQPITAVSPALSSSGTGTSASWVDKLVHLASSPLGQARGLLWTTVRIQFVCPVTHALMGSYDLEQPTDGFAAVAQGMHWAYYVAKVAFATQGLGLLLPKDVSEQLEGVWKGFADLVEASEGAEQLDGVKAATAVSAHTYRAVYDLIATSLDQEPAQAFARGWAPADRWGGMVLEKCEGRALWVSVEGAEVLRRQGLAALVHTVA